MATATQRPRAAPRCSACSTIGHTKRSPLCPALAAALQRMHAGSEDVPSTDVPSTDIPSTEVSSEPIETETCPICMETLGKTNCCTTPCGHQFCLECMFKHSKTKANCPLCRANLPGSETIRKAVQPHRGPPSTPQPGAVPYRQSLKIDNFTDQARDVWWLPTEGPRRRLLPRKVQTNIQANSSRITHVAAQGDKFLVVNSGSVIPYQPDGYSRYGPIITTNRTFSHFMLTSDDVYDIYNSAYSIE
jgi:hypothetical protein